MNEKLVSVVIPTYNRAKLVSRAIHSVLNQTYSNLECIVVDDASNDDTDTVVQTIRDDRMVYLSHKTSRHASAARNTGIAHAQGDFIAFLDSDDEWLPAKVEKQLALLFSLPDRVGMVYCWMDYFDHQGNLIQQHHPELKGYVFPHVLDAQRLGNCSTLLVRREVVENVGGFDESLPRGNDGDFIRRVSQKHEVDFVPETLVKIHVSHPGRITNSKANRYENGIKAQLDKLNKFHDELEALPKAKANILLKLAHFYCRCGDMRTGRQRILEAIRANPWVLKKVYKRFLAAYLGDRFYNTWIGWIG